MRKNIKNNKTKIFLASTSDDTEYDIFSIRVEIFDKILLFFYSRFMAYVL